MAVVDPHFPEMDPSEWLVRFHEMYRQLVRLRTAIATHELHDLDEKIKYAGSLLDEVKEGMQLFAAEQEFRR